MTARLLNRGLDMDKKHIEYGEGVTERVLLNKLMKYEHTLLKLCERFDEEAGRGASELMRWL